MVFSSAKSSIHRTALNPLRRAKAETPLTTEHIIATRLIDLGNIAARTWPTPCVKKFTANDEGAAKMAFWAMLSMGIGLALAEGRRQAIISSDGQPLFNSSQTARHIYSKTTNLSLCSYGGNRGFLSSNLGSQEEVEDP
jgi:hypothetical protein